MNAQIFKTLLYFIRSKINVYFVWFNFIFIGSIRAIAASRHMPRKNKICNLWNKNSQWNRVSPPCNSLSSNFCSDEVTWTLISGVRICKSASCTESCENHQPWKHHLENALCEMLQVSSTVHHSSSSANRYHPPHFDLKAYVTY